MPMITMEQLKKLQQNTAEEIEKDKERSSGGGSSKYPVHYFGGNGKLTVRILFNMGLGGIQRKIIRHEVGKDKIGCLSVYGEECPICSAIREAEDLRGKECGAFRKYGYKVRGVCYAQVIDFSDKFFDGKDIKKKDVITLMYPKSVYDKINNLIVEAGENLAQVVCENDGVPLVIERSQKSERAIPDYIVSFYPFGKKKSFEESDCTEGKTPEDMFQDMLSELPNLGEQFVPVNPNDEVRKANQAGSEVIRQEYISGKTVNPGDEVIPENKTEVGGGSIAPSNPPQTSAPVIDESSGDKPDCFGHHDDCDQNKCLVCPYEVDCVMA